MHILFLVLLIILAVTTTAMVYYLHWRNKPYALSPEVREFERLLGVHNPSDERMREIPDPPEVLPTRQKAMEIAKKVQEAYGNIRRLSFEEELYDVLPGSLQITASVVMTNETLKSSCSFDGRLLYELILEENGQYHEHELPFRGVPEQSVSYPVSERETLQLLENVPYINACSTQHIWDSWLREGNKYKFIEQLCRSLARGRYLGVADVDGHRCFVIFKPAAWPTKYYVRCEDFLLAKRVMYRQVYWRWDRWPSLYVRRPALQVRHFRNLRAVWQHGGHLGRSKLIH